MQVANIFPWAWKDIAVADGLGEYYALSLWSQPLHTAFALLALSDIAFDIQTKLLGFVILFIGFWGIWRLLGKYQIKFAGKTAGSLFFLLNSFFLLLFDGGQLSLALAYSVLPIVVFYFLRITENDEFAEKLKFAFWILILSVCDIRIVYLVVLVILFFLLFIFFINAKHLILILKRTFIGGVVAGIILLGFHAYWLMPAVISKPIQLPRTYDRTSQVNFLSFSSLSHSLMLQQPHWPENIFGRITDPKPEFVIIPMLVFAALFLIKRNKNVTFWLAVSMLSIFLSKGSNEPFGQIYSHLFTYLPGFSFFRDPIKFYFLISLSFSILLAFSTQILSKIKFIPVILILYLIFLAGPVFLGQMNGMFSFPELQEEFKALAGIISADKEKSRVFWMPMKTSLGYVSSDHPSVQATGLAGRRPFAIGTKGTYEVFNFLREAPFMGEIFDVTGIGYIVYPRLDNKRDDMHPDNIRYYNIFSDQLAKLPWLKKAESPIPLFKVQNHQDKFFIPQNVWIVIGSDDIYSESTKSAKLKLSENALIFAEETAGLGQNSNDIPEAKIILNDKTDLDLAASLVDLKDLIFPARNLGFEPNQTGWWKREAVDLTSWRDFLQTKYGVDNQDFDLGGGWAVGEGNLELRIKNYELRKDKILLARVMESSRSGEIRFYQNKKMIGEISTKKDKTNIRWFEIGKLDSTDNLTITTTGDINVVNALAVLGENKWLNYENQVKKYREQGRIVNFAENNTTESSAQVKYQEINPTKYLIHISGMIEPGFLVFSENFDGLWKLKGRSSVPVYSLLNGFRIEHDGDYIVEFEPQKYVFPGLIAAAVTTIVLLLCLYRKR